MLKRRQLAETYHDMIDIQKPIHDEDAWNSENYSESGNTMHDGFDENWMFHIIRYPKHVIWSVCTSAAVYVRIAYTSLHRPQSHLTNMLDLIIIFPYPWECTHSSLSVFSSSHGNRNSQRSSCSAMVVGDHQRGMHSDDDSVVENRVYMGSLLRLFEEFLGVFDDWNVGSWLFHQGFIFKIDVFFCFPVLCFYLKDYPVNIF